jgi:hypothetical protein
VAPEPLVLGEHGADRARMDVDRLHAQHVVAAPVDADPRRCPPARARRRPHPAEIARAVADHRRGLAPQVGPHELAVGAVAQRQLRARVRVDELEDRVTGGRQVHPLARAARAGHRRPHVAHPERVGDGRAPRRLDLAPDRGQPGARLARGDDVAQPERARVQAELAGARREMGGEAQRPEDRGDPQARDQVEQPPGLADADRHHRRAAVLERHMVGDAARVQRVVQAVRDGVAGPHAGDPERGAADRAVGLVVGPGEADGDRLAGRARGDVQAHERLARGAQALAERRVRGLVGAQVLLRQERQPGQVGGTPDLLRHAAETLAPEPRGPDRVGELGAECGGLVRHGAPRYTGVARRGGRQFSSWRRAWRRSCPSPSCPGPCPRTWR